MRLDKLKSDIKNDNGHVKSFRDFFSTKVDDADKDNMYTPLPKVMEQTFFSKLKSHYLTI